MHFQQVYCFPHFFKCICLLSICGDSELSHTFARYLIDRLSLSCISCRALTLLRAPTRCESRGHFHLGLRAMASRLSKTFRGPKARKRPRLRSQILLEVRQPREVLEDEQHDGLRVVDDDIKNESKEEQKRKQQRGFDGKESCTFTEDCYKALEKVSLKNCLKCPADGLKKNCLPRGRRLGSGTRRQPNQDKTVGIGSYGHVAHAPLTADSLAVLRSAYFGKRPRLLGHEKLCVHIRKASGNLAFSLRPLGLHTPKTQKAAPRALLCRLFSRPELENQVGGECGKLLHTVLSCRANTHELSTHYRKLLKSTCCRCSTLSKTD